MLDIKDLIKNKENYLELLKRKNFDATSDIKIIEEKYFSYLGHLKNEEKSRQSLNLITLKIKNISSSKQKDSIFELKNLKIEAANFSKISKEHEKAHIIIFQEIEEILSFFPNLPFNDVTIGSGEEENIVLSTNLNSEKNVENKLPHWEILEKRNLISTSEARIISGPRQIIFNDKLTKLIKALEMFMIENNESRGYKLLEVPVIVNERMLYNTSQLPKFSDDLYRISDDQYLIPTAEVPLTNFVAGKILSLEELPIKLTASTSCFRKEAGSAGKDTRGLIRLHQFRKVELVKIAHPANYKEDFDEMVTTSTNLLEKLKIPYRVVELCTGDMSFGSRKTIDIEVWMPGTQNYREISSISIMGDFQARRMNTRIKNGKEKIIPFTFNGSALAIERTIATIIENYTNSEMEIIIPKVLLKYLDFKKI